MKLRLYRQLKLYRQIYLFNQVTDNAQGSDCAGYYDISDVKLVIAASSEKFIDAIFKGVLLQVLRIDKTIIYDTKKIRTLSKYLQPKELEVVLDRIIVREIEFAQIIDNDITYDDLVLYVKLIYFANAHELIKHKMAWEHKKNTLTNSNVLNNLIEYEKLDNIVVNVFRLFMPNTFYLLKGEYNESSVFK